jgi:hypothetical protein
VSRWVRHLLLCALGALLLAAHPGEAVARKAVRAPSATALQKELRAMRAQVPLLHAEASAITGPVVREVEVFDKTGASLGFIAVYSSMG